MNKDKLIGTDVSADVRAIFAKYGFTKTATAFIAEIMEISIDEADARWDKWMDDNVYTSLFNPIIAGDEE